jgi:PD-(D/E)XK endonuclease
MSRSGSSTRRPASRPRTAHPTSAPGGTAQPSPARLQELTTKRRGELAELAFTLKAASLGFGVAKPYGDSERYDFILDPRNAHVGTAALGCPVEQSSAVCHPEEGAFCPTKARPERSRRDLGVLRIPASLPRASISDRGARLARLVLDLRNATNACHSEPAQSGGEEPAFPNGCPTLRDVRRMGTHPLYRVQVKCSTQLLNGLYRVNAHRRTQGRAVPYLASEIDFFAVYIIPEATWYVIPILAIHATSLFFRRRRDRRPGLYDQFREAWHLLCYRQPM